MTCPLQTGNADLLLDYCSRKLDWDRLAVLERHMNACPECRAMAEAQKTVWQALDYWEASPVPADFDRRLYERIEEENTEPWWRRAFPPAAFTGLRPAMSVAAACVVMVVAFLVNSPLGNDSVVSPDSAQTAIEASELEQAERTLEDMEMLQVLIPASKTEAARGSQPF